jgi:transposase
MKKVRFLGLDVHAETIAVAIAEPNGEVRSLGIIPNREESIRKLVKKLGPAEQLQACYEAGPTGYVLYWQMTSLGVKCEVVAPTLVPVKAGDRVKTDRRDASKLARSYRAGDLTAVWVPNEEHEALRDLVRAREVAKQDQLRARNRLSKFLLRHGRRAPAGIRAWTQKFQQWIKEQVHFEQPAQEFTLLDYRTRLNIWRTASGDWNKLSAAGRLPRPGILICGGSLSRRHGPTDIDRRSGWLYANDRRG